MKHVLILLAFLTSFVQGETFDSMVNGLIKGTVPVISPSQLSKELKSGNPPLLLDTRAKKEFDVSHLSGAKHFGYYRLTLKHLSDLDKSTPIVTYCSVGKRSEDIGYVLQKKGFTNVKNLKGGIFQWANEKRPISTQKGSQTTSVHPYDENWGKWLLPHINKEK